MLKEKRVKTTTAVYSDVGKVRKANEDSFYVSKDENLLIVCDGMGGQVAGGLASKIAVETIQDVFQNMDEEYTKYFLYDPEFSLSRSTRRLIVAVRLANRRIYNISTRFSKLRGMGTTVVALTLDKAFATMIHVGDSRIFRVSDKEVFQLTEDHSWLNELIEDQEINEEQIETFAQKNVITRALGTGPTVKIDVHCEKYKADDTYVLCTDGMHNTVGAKDIRRIFDKSNGSIDAATRQLIQRALRRDGSDNVTVAVARINQNSRETKRQGVSTTIPEEGDKLSQKIDKFIQTNYNEPQLNMNQSPIMNTLSRRNFMVPVMVLLTGLLCFLLGMALQGFNPARARSGGPQTTTSAGRAAPPNQIQASQAPITRSRLRGDAVMAVVFFNSTRDFKEAKLDERGTVLDSYLPYQPGENGSNQRDFSIFLIDSENNVMHKTANVQLPELAGLSGSR